MEITCLQQLRNEENMAHRHNGILFSHKMFEILSFVITWTELEVIILSEITHAQKRQDLHDLTPMGNLKKVDFIEVESRIITKAGKNRGEEECENVDKQVLHELGMVEHVCDLSYPES